MFNYAINLKKSTRHLKKKHNKNNNKYMLHN